MTKHVIAVGGGRPFKGKVSAMVSSEGEVTWVADPSDVAAAMRSAPEPAHAILIAPDVEPQDVLDLGRRVAEQAPTTAVVVLRANVTNGFLPAAMKAGVRDVIDLSTDEDAYGAVARAVAWAESVRAPAAPDRGDRVRGKVITVFSSKGGTGKSFLACNLAAVIATEWQQETALVDVDVAMGDTFAYFGQQSSHHLGDVTSVVHKDREALLSIATPLTAHLHGFATPPDPAADAMSGDDIKTLLDQIASAFDFVVVDVPGGYEDSVLTALDSSDLIILLASLDVVGVRHLAKAIETLTSIGVGEERMRVVLNRSDSVVGLTPKDVEQVLHLKVSSLIPSSRLVPASLNAGTPVVLAEPKSEVAKSITRMAEQLIGKNTHGTERRKRRLFTKS